MMKVAFVSLGCDKNLVDSEVMLGILAEAGFEITDDEETAEAAVVNTCCFINDAKEESINTLLELAERKKNGQLKALVACGCLAQRYKKEIEEEIPEVDAILGDACVAIEIKSVEEVLPKHLKGLKAFGEEFPNCRKIIVSLDTINRKIGDIEAIHILDFLKLLWQGEIA